MMRWATVFDGFYEVSDCGSVRQTSPAKGATVGKELRPATTNTGYLVVCVNCSGRRQMVYVHRMVALGFFGPKPDGFVVNHKNGIKTDNRLDNLEYVSKSDDIRHAYDMGLRGAPNRLTKEQALRVKFGGERPMVLMKELDISRTTVGDIRSGRRWVRLGATP